MLIDYDMEKTLQRRHNRQNANGLAPIQLRITISGKRCDLATGIFCPAAYWPVGTKKLVLPTSKSCQSLPEFSASAIAQLNDELANFAHDVGEIYKRLRKPNPRGPVMPVTVAQVRAQVRPAREAPVAPAPVVIERTLQVVATEFLAALQKSPAEARLAESTLLTYVTRCKTLERYLKSSQQIAVLAAEIDLPWCRKYERWLMSEAGGFSGVSMRKQVNFLQMALDFAVHEGWLAIKTLHGYKFQTKLAPPPALSLPCLEVHKLATVLPELDLPARRAVAGWLFCCYTGLSWVDYCRFCQKPAEFLFSEPDPETGETRYWLRMVRQKMKNRKPQGFSVPLFDGAADLLMLYNGRLPHSHGVNTNKLLHRVEEELGLSQSLTTKLARATFSQLKRDEGYSDEAVAAMMGDTISVMNRHYSKVSEKRIALEMRRLHRGGNF